MKLYRYKNFIKESKEDIHSICNKYDIKNYVVNADGTVDVNGDVYLEVPEISQIPIKFGKVSGDFCIQWLLNNRNKLTSLEGSPREVGGGFYCNNNQLVSLEGAPRKVGGDFVCFRNKLTSLEGISQYISGNIKCQDNQLRDVRGVKDGWRGRFYSQGNPVHKIFKLFPKKRRDEVIEYLNEHDVIRDGKIVILQRLEQVFYDMGLEVPEIDHIEGYEIQF
jgi:hypothetical protein